MSCGEATAIVGISLLLVLAIALVARLPRSGVGLSELLGLGAPKQEDSHVHDHRTSIGAARLGNAAQ